MATLREIRRRISGVKSTQKITKAMKMVAAAKLRRAQDSVVAARPYARKMKELLGHLSGVGDVTAHPLFQVKPVGSVAVIVITADRGLCGAFNANIIRYTAEYIKKNYRDLSAEGKVRLVCVGKKGHDYFNKNQYQIDGRYIGIFHGLEITHAQTIAGEMILGFESGKYDRIDIIYNEFKSIIQQRVVSERYLPIEPVADRSKEGKVKPATNYIYEPSSTAIIGTLVPKHLNFQLWHSLLESNAAEQGARMTAMESATSNASDLIRTLQLSYNKARQASITKELLEIVSGAEALKNA